MRPSPWWLFEYEQKTLRQNHVGSPWLSFSVASGNDRQMLRRRSISLVYDLGFAMLQFCANTRSRGVALVTTTSGGTSTTSPSSASRSDPSVDRSRTSV